MTGGIWILSDNTGSGAESCLPPPDNVTLWLELSASEDKQPKPTPPAACMMSSSGGHFSSGVSADEAEFVGCAVPGGRLRLRLEDEFKERDCEDAVIRCHT